MTKVVSKRTSQIRGTRNSGRCLLLHQVGKTVFRWLKTYSRNTKANSPAFRFCSRRSPRYHLHVSGHLSLRPHVKRDVRPPVSFCNPSANTVLFRFYRTFQAAYFVSIIVGLGVGEVMFGRWASFL